MAFLKQHPRHQRRNAKAEVGGLALAQLPRGTARDDLFHPVLGAMKAVPGPHDLARDRRVVGGFGGLLLVGVDHDQIDQMTRHPHLMRAQTAGRGDPLDLRDHQPAVVAHRNRLIKPPQRGPLVLVGQVAATICGGGAQDADIRHDAREMQPGLAAHLMARHNRVGAGARVHRAAVQIGVNKGFQAHLGQHAGAAGGDIAVHVEQDARGHIVGKHPVLDDHVPDRGHRQVRRTGGVRPGDDARQQPLLRQMINPLDAIHVARRNRVQGGQAARVALGQIARANRCQHLVGAPQRRRRRHRDHRPVGNP